MTCSRPIRLGVLTLFVLGLAATQAAAWGPAVHTYVADHSGKRWPFLNRTEIYGALLADAFYFASELPPGLQAIGAEVTNEHYLKMWVGACGLGNRALGFGYVSHNGEWGADSTAHDPVNGYVVLKARAMRDHHPVLIALLPDPTQREAIAHMLAEAGTDLLLKRKDPRIGSKLLLAALLRGSFVPQQYVTTFTPELAHQTGLAPEVAAGVLTEVEKGYRTAMVVYGLALMKDEDAALDTLAEQFALLAPGWDVEVPPAVIRQLLVDAMTLCELDFQDALDFTTQFVRIQLWVNGVWY